MKTGGGRNDKNSSMWVKKIKVLSHFAYQKVGLYMAERFYVNDKQFVSLKCKIVQASQTKTLKKKL